ncbi:MAG: glycosyltransferase family 2 protein [Candidatus Portnoybacteria bacterium]|nr:glycosyltransferase family 2 protein [Candidatus Portnoybacteria bacterium]
MELSVVITHHREQKLLEQCLCLLQKELEGIEAEIIIVLSECRQEALEGLKQKFPEVIFLPFEKNLYFVRSVNRGIERVGGDYVLIINDDVMVSPGSVKALAGYLKEHRETGLVGPKLLYSDGVNQHSCFRFYTPLTVVCRRTVLDKTSVCREVINRFLYGDKNLNGGDGTEVDWVVNGAVMARRDFIKQVGFLDERFKHYFSDVDWCRRFWQNGFKVVYFSKAVFYHYHGRKSRSGGVLGLLTNRMTRIHVWDGIRYFWKWGIS